MLSAVGLSGAGTSLEHGGQLQSSAGPAAFVRALHPNRARSGAAPAAPAATADHHACAHPAGEPALPPAPGRLQASACTTQGKPHSCQICMLRSAFMLPAGGHSSDMHAAGDYRAHDYPGPYHSARAYHHTGAWLCDLPVAGPPAAKLMYHAALRPAV